MDTQAKPNSASQPQSPSLTLIINAFLFHKDGAGKTALPRLGFGPDEVAAIAGPGRSKIYEELSAGRLRAKKVGSSTIIPLWSIIDWMEHLPAWGTATQDNTHKAADVVSGAL